MSEYNDKEITLMDEEIIKQMDKIKESIKKDSEIQNPTDNELNSPVFNEIWQTIKDWDISTDGGETYSGATGSHAVKIYRAALKGTYKNISQSED